MQIVAEFAFGARGCSPRDRLMLSERIRKVVAQSSWNTGELLDVYYSSMAL